MLHNYILREELVENHYYSIHLASEKTTGKSVLIKKKNPNYPQSLNKIFKREYSILEKIKALPIISPIILEQENEEFVLVLESEGFIPLSHLFKYKQLEFEEIISKGIEIISILNDLHRNGFVHCNLCPDNLFINPHTQQIKITGFENSISTENNDGSISTLFPSILNMNYIAPEQSKRIKLNIDFRTDYYSFGAILFELLTCEKKYLVLRIH